MNQASRLRDIVAILENSRHPVRREYFLDELDISLATFKRDLDVLRDQMQAPIVWQRADFDQPPGYVLEDKGWSSGKLGLPRAWFSATEIYALLMIDELARHIGPGLLTEHLQPLVTRVTMMLGAADDTPEDIRSRVRILSSASKRKAAPHFETVAKAAVRKRRIQIRYFARSRNERSERVVSPQRLIHYKENWYLVAWCHKVDGPRMFALDSIEEAVMLKDEARSVARKEIDALIGRDFGIYAGKKRQWAKLVFTPDQARWVTSEIWHPEQKSETRADGSYVLEVPYSDSRELVLEILRFGADVEVVEPAALRKEVATRLRAAAARYSAAT
jgi:predicted DNA-binding transcriptional regulator YafY